MISRLLRPLNLVVFASLVGLIVPTALQAQTGTSQIRSSLVTNRLTRPIDNNVRVTLKGTVHPLANAMNDRGAAPASMPLNRIQIVLKRSAAQETALQQLIEDQNRPGSASYHKWLTPEQFGQKFGPSDQDVATLEAWLQSQGFDIEKLNPGRQTLEVSGSAAQFQNAFHAQIHKYEVNGQTHFANATNPQIPAALAPVFGGFASLNDFHPRPLNRVLGHATYNSKTGQTTPQWTTSDSSGVSFALAPGDFRVQYDLPTNLDGSGQTIAIVNESNINVAQVKQFRDLFGLPDLPVRVIVDGNDPGIDGISNPDGPNGASLEAYLDVEWAGAVAPGATIDLVISADTALSNGLILAAEHAVYGDIAPVISISFGLGCEQQLGSSNQFVNELWEQAAAQGITVVVASGDSGSAGCDYGTQFAVGGAAVSGLASTPYDVAVGGTDFYYSSYNQGTSAIDNQLATYWNTAPTQGPAVSLKSVVPEQPWNDSQYGLNLASFYQSEGKTVIDGGSGGASSCITGTTDPTNGEFSTCTGGYPKPVWQSGNGVPNDKVRDIPDVSLFAANGLNASFYPLCASDGDCQSASGSNIIQITAAGGTSASAPAFAGIMALVNEKYGRQGQADAVLYPLAAQYPAAFHDVTNGTNSVPCAFATPTDTPDCIAVSNPLPPITDSKYGTYVEGQIGTGTTPEYNATAGYDLATGLGSVDAAQLIADWGNITFAGTSINLTSPVTGDSFTHGSSAVTFKGTVTSTGGLTPTGDVAIETDNTDPVQQGQATATLSGGSFSVTTSKLPGGTYNVWARYAGDSKNASADSQKALITVSPETSGIYLSADDVATGRAGAGPVIASGATNIPYGTQLLLNAQVVPGSQLAAFQSCQSAGTACPTFAPPTGTVAFADGATVSTAVLNANGEAEMNGAWGVGPHSITASYSGDNSYKVSTAPAFTFTIAKDTPTLVANSAAQASNGELVGSQATVITVLVENSANLASEQNYGIGFMVPVVAPTGTVTVSSSPAGISGTITLSPATAAVDPSNYFADAVATITAPATTPGGNYTLTISYSGDANYSTYSTTVPVTIATANGLASTTTASVTGSISPSSNITVSGTVTGKTGHAAPTGGVIVYSSGYDIGEVTLTAGSSDVSTFAFTLDSGTLFQGTNVVTLQYTGDNTYNPSSFNLSNPISNPLADFTMVPNSTIVPVTAGTSATELVQLTPVNGYSGSVNLTCGGFRIQCSITPSTYNLSGGPATATVVIDAQSDASNGPNNLGIMGEDLTSGIIHTLGIQVDVTGATAPAAGFSINANPGTLTIAPGATSGNKAYVSVMPANGFKGAVTLTAAVTGPSGATSPPTLAFNPGSLDINGESAISSTLAVTTTSTTTEGNYTVMVTGTSSSGTETAQFTVNVSSASFALDRSPTSLTLAAGAKTGNTSRITVTPSGGFTGMVSFTCAVTTAPPSANDPPTCSAPSANVSGTTAATATLTVNTTATTTSASHTPLDKFFAAGGGVMIAGLLFFGIPARRRKWRSILVILVFAGIAGLGIGCGGGSSGGGGGGGGTTIPGTTAGSYVLTVTGTSGTLTATTTVNLTVN